MQRTTWMGFEPARRACAVAVVLAAWWAAPATAAPDDPVPGSCNVTNPPNGESANPCRAAVDGTWTYFASGEWEIRIERPDGTEERLGSENDDPERGGRGLFRDGDVVSFRAVTPGSFVIARDTGDPLAPAPPYPANWPDPGKHTVESDGCAEDERACVKSVDGAVIRYTLMLPEGGSAASPVPLVVAAHEFGQDRRIYTADPPSGLTAHLLAAGYAVAAYDARGHGASGGEAKLNDPAYEGIDVMRLIDKLRHDPRIAQEAPGDPRVGMVGSSYGGEIQLVAAALDPRIDAIVPDSAWNDLARAVAPDGVFKTGWGTLLPGATLTTLEYTGWQEMKDVTRWESGTLDPQITAWVAQGLATGDLPEEARDWARDLGPWNLLDGFDTPTMILHGQQDTLFPPSEAAANVAALRDTLRGDKLKLRWYCGGHGTCKPSYFGPLWHRRNTDAIRFLDRWVKGDEDADSGPRFAYVTQDGRWRESGQLEPKPSGHLTATGSGTVTVTGEAGTGGAYEVLPAGRFQPPRPAHTSLKIRIPSGRGRGTILGAGRVTMTATGAGHGLDTGASAAVFLRLVDERTQTVLGNQTMPVVLRTDGRPHVVSVALEPVAWRLGQRDRLALEVLGASTLFEPHRGTAVIELEKVDVELPVVE